MTGKRKKSRSKKQRKAKDPSEANATEAPEVEDAPHGDEPAGDEPTGRSADRDDVASSEDGPGAKADADVVFLDDDSSDDSLTAVLEEVLALDEDEATSGSDANDAPQVVALDEGDDEGDRSDPDDRGEDPSEIVSLDDEDEDDDEEDAITEFSLDDDEEEDRERLIAETLAFVAAEEGDVVVADESDADADALPTGVEPESDAEEAVETEPDEGPRISISYDAVAALTEMQAQGLIDLPDDLVIDLGEASTDEQRDRLLAAALAHVEMQEARYRVPTDTGQGRRWKGTAASALVMLAMLVVVAPPGILVPDPPAQLTESDRTYGVLVALLLQAQQIDAFQVRELRLPNDLDEVGTVLPDIRFVKSSNRLYQLVAYTSDGIAVVYDSAAPADIFQRVAANWVTTRGEM